MDKNNIIGIRSPSANNIRIELNNNLWFQYNEPHIGSIYDCSIAKIDLNYFVNSLLSLQLLRQWLGFLDAPKIRSLDPYT